ncbi:putative endonuclease 4 [Clostridiales bacterium]|nr:putative endonuclease 4 [Clostridiales bacterium]
MLIGSHVSISGGLLGAAKEAFSYGANTFMVYTGAPQNTIRKPISDLKIDEGKQFMEENGISDIVIHAPYIINLASYKENTFTLAKEFLAKELERAASFGSKYIVLHPGAYTDKTAEYGIEKIAEGLNYVINAGIPDIYICLETMAGKGSEIGRSFEELKLIIDKIDKNEYIGVCFDTCHTHDSGYDIVNNFDGVIDEFDKIIGLDRLKVMHINGSLNERGARKDRHANIGADETNPKGKDCIGFDAINYIVHHEKTEGRPFILETPWISKTENLYKKEISLLRGEKK